MGLKSWYVQTTSRSTMRIAFCCGLGLLAMGFLVHEKSRRAAQVRVIYQPAAKGETWLASKIPWGTQMDEVTRAHECNHTTCHVKIPRKMTPPLLVYYGVGPFYQNIVSYLKSEVSQELMGKYVAQATREAKCRDKESRERDGKQMVPCGTKAATLFNDTLELVDQNGNQINITKTGIAWESDVKRYNNPPDYPNRPNTTWLYQQHPGIVSNQTGVKSEAFASWMRPAALGRVWNHYGWVEQEFNGGDTISFKINSSFNANESSKFFAITERNIFGGRHNRFGSILMIVGGSCLFLSFLVCLHDMPKR